jgi:hypothetical protein
VEQEAFLVVDWHEGQDTIDSSMEVALYLIKSYEIDLGYLKFFPNFKHPFWNLAVDPIIR